MNEVELIAVFVMLKVVFSIFLINGDSGVVVESLGHELQGQWVLVPGGFLDLGPLVLEPDFDLIFVELQLVGQLLAPLLVEVAVLGEFGFEAGQLLRRERRARSLLFGRSRRLGRCRAAILLDPSASRSCSRNANTTVNHQFNQSGNTAFQIIKTLFI